MTDPASKSDGMDEDPPFRQVEPYYETLHTLTQIRDLLDDIEANVKEAQWVALGGRGGFQAEQTEQLATDLDGWQEKLVEQVAQLPDPHEQKERWDDK